MLTFSGLYNMFDQSAWSGLLRRLDHACIYFKIAGTYTPFTLTTVGHAIWLLVAVWGAARPCCTNRLGDSLHESSVIAEGHEQLGPYEIQDNELVGLQ